MPVDGEVSTKVLFTSYLLGALLTEPISVQRSYHDSVIIAVFADEVRRAFCAPRRRAEKRPPGLGRDRRGR
jgi:hypothetical protein